MPSKKKKFNARFPPARIKKIMQTDEDVGKVAAAVPVIISKALEMFVQSLVERASEYTRARNAKTMTTSHLKRCITSENQFDFLKDLVENVPDLPSNEEEKDGEPKPKRKRAQRNPPAQNREKKKTEKKKPQAAAVSDESDEEPESEEEDSSSEGPSNPSSVGNTHANCSNSALAPPLPVVPSITVTKPDSEQTEEPTSSSSTAPLAIPRLAQVSGVMGNSLDNEDDDYDS